MRKEWELIKNIYGCTTILMQETEAKETENAFKVVEKSLKALEIIKGKSVDMLLIKKYDNASDYNSAVWLSGREKLTEEEYEMIGEVLE